MPSASVFESVSKIIMVIFKKARFTSHKVVKLVLVKTLLMAQLGAIFVEGKVVEFVLVKILLADG